VTEPQGPDSERAGAAADAAPPQAPVAGEPPPVTQAPPVAETPPAAETPGAAETPPPTDTPLPTETPPAADTPTPAGIPAASAQPEVVDARDAVVTVSGVSRSFGDHVVVEGLDLTIPAGTVLGVIGPSGSGKTTTIRMLTGALRPTTGDIRVLGERPSSFRRSTRERIGYMPQLFTLYPDLTARENVDFVGSLFGMLWPRRRRRTREVLKLLELWDARDRRASAMSGGMQRRLELACALVHEPILLFLDEPTAGIDPILRAKVWEELHRLRDAGTTILVTTQYVGDAEDCDQVALIAEGRLVALAGPDELRRQAQGGDMIQVQTASMFDASVVGSVAGVTRVDQRSPREFVATVDDSAVALPAVVDAVTAAGAEVVAAQELRASFDEIFAMLVARARETADRDSAKDAAA
jgi:ABC-2 type transport system ATP-binding protein